MNTQPKINLLNNILLSALGFGLGGLYWGWEIYNAPVDVVNYTIFSELGAATILGVLGGLSLSFSYLRRIKKALLTALLGVMGFLLGFIISIVLSYPLYLWGGGFNRMTFGQEFWESISLNMVGDLFLAFAIIGIVVGIFYALALKEKVLKTAILGMIGFALGSIIAPIIGNLFASLLAAYLVTFALIGIILGIFLALGLNKSQKPISTDSQ